jgi:hypothetical protein
MFIANQQNCYGEITSDMNTSDHKYIPFNCIMPQSNMTDDEKQRLVFALKIHELMAINVDIRKVVYEFRNEFRKVRTDLRNYEPSIELKISENENLSIVNSIAFKLGGNDLLSFSKSDKNFVIISSNKNDEIIHFIFHPEGYISSVMHFNSKFEQIGHYAEWNREGQLIREGNHTKPLPLKLLKERY